MDDTDGLAHWRSPGDAETPRNGALDPSKLAEARQPDRKLDKTRSFRVVVRHPRGRGRPWYFQIVIGDGKTKMVGGYATEQAAAVARDRAALHYLSDPVLNFPERARELGAADSETLRAAIFAERKRTTSSKCRGVYVEKNEADSQRRSA